jgi:hypothetical protein
MHQNTRQKTIAVLSAIVGVMAASDFNAHAQTDTNATSKLEKENQELRKRLDDMEAILVKEGLKPTGKGAAGDPPVGALTDVTLSGFVTSSYFYDLASSKDGTPNGYLWDRNLNSFTLNKVKLTLASPAPDKDKWSAAFRVSFIWGSDAPYVDTSSTKVPGFSWLREAYAELNIPIGTGLDIKAGELISLLNYESGDGGAVNDNFSQGYQWFNTGNPPDAAVRAAYDFNDMFGIKLSLQNGLYTGPVGIGPKTFLGGFYVKPDKKTSLAFLGFVGPQFGNVDLCGGSFIGSRQLMESHHVSVGTEIDYFDFSHANPGGAGAADAGSWWSGGVWLGADLTDKLRIALRGEYLGDSTGFGTGFVGFPSGFPAGLYAYGQGQDLEEVTLTLDYKPVATIKIQPEIRWNHSNNELTFGLKRDQIIAGMGVSYLF